MKKLLAGSALVLVLGVSGYYFLQDKPASQKAELGEWGIDLTAVDDTTRPGDDFFQYVNGAWLDSFEIPSDFTNYGAFTKLIERSETRTNEIIQGAVSSGGDAGSEAKKIGDYYSSFIDTGTINALGLSPLEDDLAYFGALETHEDVAKAMNDWGRVTGGPIGLYIYVDEKQPSRYAVYANQGGLGLPNRDYYLEDNFENARSEYRKFIKTILTNIEARNADEAAEAIYNLEAAIAQIHWPMAKQRNRDLTYNPYTIDELVAFAPEFPWREAMVAAGVGDQDRVILNENDAIQQLAKLFRETPVSVWKDYLTFKFVINHSSVLPRNIDEAVFAFYGQVIGGQPEQKARWKRGVAAVNNALGEAVGKIYVEQYFPPESKEMMQELIENFRVALDQRLGELDWMSEETRRQAQLKLSKFKAWVGYPETWNDYSSLEIKAGDALGNLKRSNRWTADLTLGRLGKEVDPGSEWGMTPQFVNAYYSPPRNSIYFPAAILQAPFFDPAADPAINYGGIGAVIGHEIMHGFDDQGRKSDGDGFLSDWWTPEDIARFETRTSAFGAQFASYTPIDDMNIDPILTMGENVADLGGLAVAYQAYKISLGGVPAPILDDFTGEQRFFMAWAQVWRRKYRDEDLRFRMVSDPHSPSEYRTNGIVRNLDAWYRAFNVVEGDELFLSPEDRVRIW